MYDRNPVPALAHDYVTPETCEHCRTGIVGCMVCDGGLALCRNCGLLEGALTTDCPGEQVNVLRSDEIYKGTKDYRANGGGWIDGTSPHSPAFIRNETDAVRREDGI